METVFDSTELPIEERTDAWQETLSRALVTTHNKFPEDEPFTARLKATALGPAQLSSMTYTGLVSWRTQALIRKSDPELYQIAVVRSGRQGIEQERRLAVIDPGDMVLYDSSRPFEATVAPGAEPSTSLVLQFPRRLLPLPEHRVAALLALPLPGRKGMGRMLSRFLMSLDEDSHACTPRDRARLGVTGLDLIAGAVAHHLDREQDLPPDSRQHLLFLRITSFIHEHLNAPDLDPVTIAAAHHISLRTLHRLFSRHGTSVAAFIRQQRLQRSRRDLADPRLNHLGIRAVAARCGFFHPADFTRAFHTAYGMPPSEYRRFVQHNTAGTQRKEGGTQTQGRGADRD
ncbi:helix-turn-helix domain-containing protein [Streptomyces sp. ST2-7A]|uniref:AraC-like ligand-binding domain-containing protein n=1 Tax=Streptomyces sp. ST2-7A TaxID=2907214 RepID=UPI001F15C134|nr:helix-turn-helix domain-containing protein [Streptomyces sp. ST2-7A]MCE7082940.1 helix-turn-helix domain-containing protein [Streptomyces sp. ST2-7A]